MRLVYDRASGAILRYTSGPTEQPIARSEATVESDRAYDPKAYRVENGEVVLRAAPALSPPEEAAAARATIAQADPIIIALLSQAPGEMDAWLAKNTSSPAEVARLVRALAKIVALRLT